MSREQFQRAALVTLVVLLAALASDRLMAMMQPTCIDDRVRIARVHVTGPAIAAEEARRLGEEARRIGAEARRIAEEHRRIVEVHRHRTEERCEIEQELDREMAREMARAAEREQERFVVVR